VPIYDYVCGACGHRLEVIHGVSDAGPHFCPECGAEGTMKKAFVPPAIHFKGSGWAKKDRSATATPGKTPASKKSDAAGSTSEGASGATDRPAATGTAAASPSGTESGSSGSSEAS
jgi:putative FmdB family regulatory protein